MLSMFALALQVVTSVQRVSGPSFQTTAETQPIILYYHQCLSPAGVAISVPVDGTAETQAKARIGACSATRAWALSAGTSAYKQEPGGDPDARHYLNTSLDQVEQGYIANARFTDKLVTGQIDPSVLNDKAVVLKPDDTPAGEPEKRH